MDAQKITHYQRYTNLVLKPCFWGTPFCSTKDLPSKICSPHHQDLSYFEKRIWAHESQSPLANVIFCHISMALCPAPLAVLQPCLPQVDTDVPLPALFGATPWTECPDAELSEVIQYLKKSQYLHVPTEWQPFIFWPTLLVEAALFQITYIMKWRSILWEGYFT